MAIKLTLVKNEEKYWEFIRELRNEPSYKNNFGEQHDIDKRTHFAFMKKYGNDYYICLHNDGNIPNAYPVGWVGEVNNDIRVCVHKNFQQKGIGVFMLKEFMKIHPNAKKCFAKIKLYNTASLKAFLNAGFEITNYYLEPK